MGTATSFPYDTVRREVYRANSLDAAVETAAALAIDNSLTTVDEQVSWLRSGKRSGSEGELRDCFTSFFALTFCRKMANIANIFC
jgi:hypothetical protein